MDFFSLTELTVCETSEAKTRKMETYFFYHEENICIYIIKSTIYGFIWLNLFSFQQL